MKPGSKYPYDFGFLPAMGRLLRAHDRIGPTLADLFGDFDRITVLRREKQKTSSPRCAF